jgi:hypothetical protein
MMVEAATVATVADIRASIGHYRDMLGFNLIAQRVDNDDI